MPSFERRELAAAPARGFLKKDDTQAIAVLMIPQCMGRWGSTLGLLCLRRRQRARARARAPDKRQFIFELELERSPRGIYIFFFYIDCRPRAQDYPTPLFQGEDHICLFNETGCSEALRWLRYSLPIGGNKKKIMQVFQRCSQGVNA